MTSKEILRTICIAFGIVTYLAIFTPYTISDWEWWVLDILLVTIITFIVDNPVDDDDNDN